VTAAMFPLLRSLTVRYLLQKWDRSALVALSIALGVATLVSTRLLNQCVEAAALDSTVPADVADLYADNGEIGVDWGVAEDLKAARIPGVTRVQPFVVVRVVMPELGDRSAVVFGSDLSGAAESDARNADILKITFTPINPYALTGRWVAMSRRLYEARKLAGKADTDPVEIRYTNVTERFVLAAVIDVAKDSPIAPFATNMLAMDVKTAARLHRRPGADAAGGDRVTRVDLFLDDPGNPETRERVEAVVGGRAKVRTPEANRKSTEEVIGGVKLVLNLCSLGALVVGLFLVYNALAVTVAERRHDIGVMRSLGATRGQIARLFATEAMLLGALGALPGIPLGVWLADLAINQFGEELTSVFLNTESFRPHLSPLTGAIAVAAGMTTALMAALVPALQAASDEPADAVRRAPSTAGRVLRWVHRFACVGLVVAGVGTVLLRRYLPSRTGSLIGMTLILTGLFLAMPIFVGWLARLLHPMFRWLLGVEARLAADNLIRSPGRTGVVIGALAAGVSLMFQTAGVCKSNEVPIREWLEQVVRADAFLFRGNLASANSSMTPMDPGLREKVQAIPGVERVVGLRFKRLEYNGTLVLLIGIDAVDYKRAIRARVPEGLPALDLMERLPEGNVTIVSDNFAAKWKVRVGDAVTVPGRRGPVDLQVIGIGRDYSWSQGTIFVDRARYAELFDDPLVDAYHVFFHPEADYDATFEAVRQYADREQLLIQDRPSVHLYLAGVIDRLFRVAYLQQVIVAIVAALGVVTALLISVLQRRRELGLLRAVGATQPQVLKSVLAEAMLMGLLGTLLGFALGLPMEWYLLRVVMREETGFVFDVLLPWKEALGIGLISVVASTLAGLVPALHAVRLRIPDAIAYE
jgi:putative ABC transport system permease protein